MVLLSQSITIIQSLLAPSSTQEHSKGLPVEQIESSGRFSLNFKCTRKSHYIIHFGMGQAEMHGEEHEGREEEPDLFDMYNRNRERKGSQSLYDVLRLQTSGQRDLEQFPTRVMRKRSGEHPGQEGYRSIYEEWSEHQPSDDEPFNPSQESEQSQVVIEDAPNPPQAQFRAFVPSTDAQRNYHKYFMSKMVKELRHSGYAQQRLYQECSSRGVSVRRVIGLIKDLTDIRGPPSLALLKHHTKPKATDSRDVVMAKDAFWAYLEVFLSCSFERMVRESDISDKRQCLEYGYRYLANVRDGTSPSRYNREVP